MLKYNNPTSTRLALVVLPIPTPLDFTFFTLSSDESSPILLISPLSADTIDETLFWIPSISTLIAGDPVYSHTVYLRLADLLSTALTQAWLSTLDYVEHLNAHRIIPGHSLTIENFGPTKDLEHSRKYVQFFKDEIESKGLSDLGRYLTSSMRNFRVFSILIRKSRPLCSILPVRNSGVVELDRFITLIWLLITTSLLFRDGCWSRTCRSLHTFQVNIQVCTRHIT